MKAKTTPQDLIISYIIGFPVAVTLIFAWMVLKSDGVFTVDMTLYGEFYFEAFLFVLWIYLFTTKGMTYLNSILKTHATTSRG